MIKFPQTAVGLSQEMKIAVYALARAGHIIKNWYGITHSGTEKGVSDLVSKVDFEVDQVVCEFLRTQTPGYGLISEELNPQNVSTSNKLWIFDPLDATSAFLFEAGIDLPSSMIALKQEDEIKLGAVFFPLTNTWFYAEKGKGAYRNEKAIKITGCSDLKNSWVVMNHYGDSTYGTTVFKLLYDKLRSPHGAKLVTIEVPHSGIAMHMLEGKKRISAIIHDNNPLKVKQSIWDVSAPQIIVEEAGGVFLDSRGVRYNPFEPDMILIAKSRNLADEILSLVNQP